MLLNPDTNGIALIDPQCFQQHANTRAVIANQIKISDDFDRANILELASRVEVKRYGSTALLRLEGPIEFKSSIWMYWFGGTSCRAFSQEFQSAMDDSEIEKIVIEVDSPGGHVSGVPELARQIFTQRAKKPTIAVASPFAASAATWIATACGQVVVMGSGRIGSIGSYMLHTELSKAYEEAGFKFNMFRSPQFKADWNYFESMPEESAKFYQDEVNKITSDFQQAIARHRGVKLKKVQNDFGQGRMLTAQNAVAVGLADKIGSLQDVVLQSGKRSKERTHIRGGANSKFRRAAMERITNG